MKHIAAIQAEFLKEARKWDDLTLEEQKGYLSRHPRTKRKLTAKPDATGKKKKEVKKERGKKKIDSQKDIGRKKIEKKKKELKKAPKEDTTKGTGTYAEFAAKLVNKSPDDIKKEMEKLQAKIDKRENAAARREQRAHGDLDGTAFEAAYERSRPDIMRKKLLEHYLKNGTNKLPKELQEEFDEHNEDQKRKKERKEEHKDVLDEHKHLMGKTVTWKSRKHFNKEMSGRVIAVKANKYGSPYVKTDTGWKVPVSMIEKSKAPSKDEVGKVQIKAKDLVGKKVSWKSKFKPGWTSRRGFRFEKQPPPGWDRAKGTAGGVVDGAKGSKVTIGGWRIPLSMISHVDDKEFTGWE